MKPPSEASCTQNCVWELKKPVYGLSDASLRWYKRVLSFILSSGGKVSILDPALFLWHKDEKLIGIIALHVDDFIWAGTKEFEESIIRKLRCTFVVGKEQSISFRYLGLNVQHLGEEIVLHQHDYLEALKPLSLSAERRKLQDQPVTDEEKEAVRAKIGQLLWVSTQTCPDICFDVSNLATNLKNSCTVKDILRINKIILKLKEKQLNLRFQPIKYPKLIVYTDASFGNLLDGGSQGGYLVFLAGEDGICNLVSWQSKRLKRVVRSTLTAETLAMMDGIDAGLFIASLYSEIVHGRIIDGNIPIEVITDNNSLIDALNSSKPVTDKRLRIDISALKESIQHHSINCQWVPGDLQLSDCLTKQGASSLKLTTTMETGKLPTY